MLDAADSGGVSDPIAATLTHRSAALQATIGVDSVLFSAGTETHSVLLFRETGGRAEHAQVLVHYQLELAKRAGRKVDRVILGISEPFSAIRQLGRAYRQSKLAAQAAAVDPPLGELVDSRSAGIYQLFERLQAPGGGTIRVPCTSRRSRTPTATASCCPCSNCFTTATAPFRMWPRSSTCTAAASTTDWPGSASLSERIR
ncbi:conserved hypothetical protein [Arthrobacter sp. Hiyo8]|nr:conserved hypothetical protein [Arthrobacter sp. Hiyo8]